MEYKYKDEPTFKVYTGLCQWAVCCDNDGKDCGGIKHTLIVAVFSVMELAENYISSIKQQDQDKFYICPIEL